MRLLFALALAGLAWGCAIKNTAMYGGDNLPSDARAVISSLGVHDSKQLRIQVISINGEPVDLLKTASFIVPPGSYQVAVHAVTSVSVTQGAQGLTYSKKSANGEVTVVAQAGHTYIPNGQILGERVRLYFDDAGKNFPTECLPTYVVVNTSSNPGHALYRTDKKCQR
jgi:hypothetical protein